MLTLKEQQMEALRKVCLVKSTEQLNDRAHVETQEDGFPETR